MHLETSWGAPGTRIRVTGKGRRESVRGVPWWRETVFAARPNGILRENRGTSRRQ
jgi:hypothetical protein